MPTRRQLMYIQPAAALLSGAVVMVMVTSARSAAPGGALEPLRNGAQHLEVMAAQVGDDRARVLADIASQQGADVRATGSANQRKLLIQDLDSTFVDAVGNLPDNGDPATRARVVMAIATEAGALTELAAAQDDDDRAWMLTYAERWISLAELVAARAAQVETQPVPPVPSLVPTAPPTTPPTPPVPPAPPTDAPSPVPTNIPTDVPTVTPTVPATPSPTEVPTHILPTELPTDILPTELPTERLPAQLPTEPLPTDVPADLPTELLPSDLPADLVVAKVAAVLLQGLPMSQVTNMPAELINPLAGIVSAS